MLKSPADGPVFSIITPCYNAADTIEATIRSVYVQTYPHVEHIVMDGGSPDSTVDILKRYPHLRWISEPDKGQADALNKGFRMACGDLIGWLNADDVYKPDTLRQAASLFAADTEVEMLHGDMDWINADGRPLRVVKGREMALPDALLSNPVNQQAAFFRRSIFDRAGYLRTDLHYVMDYEFWLRLAGRVRSRYVPELWASFRMAPGTKTVSQPEQFWLEILAVYDEIFSDPSLPAAIASVKRLAYGRMHWLAATGLCRAGAWTAAQDHIHRALVNYDLLAEDYLDNVRLKTTRTLLEARIGVSSP
jgi:glycosyltransferase involved in cell wall biosynthesis